MNRKIDYKINENDTGKTVEGFLKEHGYTHQVLVRLKQTDHGILRNGIWTYTNERLCKDDLITVQIVENECSDNIAPVNLPLDIAYEDDDIIVINKPFDMPAHPSAGNHDNTLANALMYYYGSQNKPFVYRCINRLDREYYIITKRFGLDGEKELTQRQIAKTLSISRSYVSRIEKAGLKKLRKLLE